MEAHLHAGDEALHSPFQQYIYGRTLLALADHSFSGCGMQPPQPVAHIGKLLLVVEIDEARHLPQRAPYNLARLGRGHAADRVPVLGVVGQHVVDLAVLQLAHVVLDGVACADVDR